MEIKEISLCDSDDESYYTIGSNNNDNESIDNHRVLTMKEVLGLMDRAIKKVCVVSGVSWELFY
jgi:hypothetical protein